MEKNRVKIICNSYKKSIEYMRWCLDEEQDIYTWGKLGSKSRLLSDKKYKNATIQHNAYDIVKEIASEYNRGTVGVEIVFDGTREDYEDLKEVVDKFFYQAGVSCELGDLYIDSASYVMPEIQNVFGNLAQVFYDYSTEEEEINKIIAKFLETTKTEIPIFVMGMYSTGKSAFINSLIGVEVLPSAVDPTTARNYKIIESEKNGSIKFDSGTEKITIYYEEDQYNIEGNIEEELSDKIHNSLEKVSNPSLTYNMYYSLDTINKYADKTKKIAELIEVEVPFYNGVLVSDNFKFIIYDTPGSDSESHEEHLSVLKKALGDQTNGLPILLTSPKDMDRDGADKLLNVINRIDGNLDLTNAMIIVNQADGVSGKSLDKVKESADTILSKWKANRLYFMSAIMGLGSKKNDYKDEYAWIDADYDEVFFKNMDCFTNCQSRSYKQLYTHNKIAPNRMEKYLSLVADEKGERRLLYINSGLHCVENEILDFARKYALYNKCAQAQDYLEKVIGITKEKISEIEKMAEDIKQSLINEQSEEKKVLLKNLSDCIAERKKTYTDIYPTHMDPLVRASRQTAANDITTFVTNIWESVKEKDKKKRVDEFLSSSREAFIKTESKFKDKILERSKKYWTKKKSELQKECCNIIKAEEDLLPEEQKILEDFIMNLDIHINVDEKINVSPDDVRIYLIKVFEYKLFPINRISQKKTQEIYVKLLDNYIRRVNTKINDVHKDEFSNWNKKLETGLTNEVGKFNPKLRKLSAELDDYEREIDRYKLQVSEIEKEQFKIVQMFEFKKREE